MEESYYHNIPPTPRLSLLQSRSNGLRESKVTQKNPLASYQPLLVNFNREAKTGLGAGTVWGTADNLKKGLILRFFNIIHGSTLWNTQDFVVVHHDVHPSRAKISSVGEEQRQ